MNKTAYISCIKGIENELKKKLPGKEYQFLMAPVTLPPVKNIPPEKNAAVMIVLFPEKNIPSFLLIKRAEYAGVHSGQISLPGGKTNNTDANLVTTALRETEEETGIIKENITIIGKLSDLFIPVSGFRVQPFIGYLHEKPVLIPDKTEVDYIIETPLNILLNPDIKQKTKMVIRNQLIEVPFYNIQENKVWGATAMILSELEELLKRNSVIEHL